MTLKLTLEIELDDDIYGSTPEELLWMEYEVLKNDGSLILHSNDIGDTVGIINKVTNIQWINTN